MKGQNRVFVAEKQLLVTEARRDAGDSQQGSKQVGFCIAYAVTVQQDVRSFA